MQRIDFEVVTMMRWHKSRRGRKLVGVMVVSTLSYLSRNVYDGSISLLVAIFLL